MGSFQRFRPVSDAISVEDAQKLVLEEVSALEAEDVPIAEALGRVLREDVVAPEDVPLKDNSAMDGYAVRSADLKGATDERPAALTVLDDLAANSDARVTVRGGAAVRIMTGAPLPPGADAVIQVEETDAGSTTVRVYRSLKSGTNIRYRGEDIHRGDVVLRAGMTLRAGEIGVLATVRRKAVQVGRQPSVAILATGDEIVSGRVPNSNSFALSALARESGAIPNALGAVPDEPVATRRALEQALQHDVVITSGGVSKGAFDFVKDALEDLGAETKFWQVAMKPGKPVIVSRVKDRLVFGLPGNPVSCIVCFLLFVRPALRKMMGQTSDLLLPEIRARAAETMEVHGDRRTYFRVRLVTQAGDVVAYPMRVQGSGVTTSMVAANGLAWLDADNATVEEGARVPVLVFGPIATE